MTNRLVLLIRPSEPSDPPERFEVPLPPDVVASNLGMQLDAPLSRLGYRSIMRGPSGASWERTLSLASKLVLCFLLLIAAGGASEGTDGIGVAIVSLIAAGGVWAFRRPLRYQLALSASGSTTLVEVVAGRSTKASVAIDAFARAHGGMSLSFESRSGSSLIPPAPPTV